MGEILEMAHIMIIRRASHKKNYCEEVKSILKKHEVKKRNYYSAQKRFYLSI